MYLYPFKSYGGDPKFQITSRDHDHVHFWGSVCNGLASIFNVCTKNEVSIYNHSKDIKGVLVCCHPFSNTYIFFSKNQHQHDKWKIILQPTLPGGYQ